MRYLLYTHLKFNSSPLKSYRNPMGKDRFPTTMAFRGELLNFRGVPILGGSNLMPMLLVILSYISLQKQYMKFRLVS